MSNAAEHQARIICLGNRFRADDAAAFEIFELLSATGIPSGVELHDGGMAGLNLILLFENCRRVVLIDTISGFAAKPGIALFDAEQIISGKTWGDTLLPGGPAQLVQTWRQLNQQQSAVEIWLVGLEQIKRWMVPLATRLCLEVAVNGLPAKNC